MKIVVPYIQRVDIMPKKKYFTGMPMSEKNESYLFDLLEGMNKSLKGIQRTLIIMSFAFSLFTLGSLLILTSG